MNISKVSTRSTITAAAKPNSVISELQKQKVTLKEQISTITASKEDAKVKAAKIKVLNEKIVEIEKQIIQAQIAERQKELEERQQKNAEKTEKQKYENEDDFQKDGVMLSASLNDLVSAKANNSTLKNMDGVRRKLQGEMNVAETQMKYSHNGSIEYQLSVLSKNANKISELADKIVNKVDEINNNVEKSKKKGLKEAEENRSHNKIKENKEEKDGADVSNTDKVQKESEDVRTDVSTSVNYEESKNNENQAKRIRRPKSVDIVV